MNEQARSLARDTAAQYASWFRALADPTRVQILSLLARSGGPLSVGAITGAVDVGQSTVSAHLKVLAEVGFVLAERRGTSVRYRVNDRCVDRFPTAADVVMGGPAPAAGRTRGGLEGERMTRSPEPGGPASREVLIRPMEPADAGQVLAIYQAGLDTDQASFETTAPAWEHFDAGRLPAHRLVAVHAVTGQVLGWTAANAVSDRCVYAGVIEHSVYTHPAHRRRGVGAVLLAALIESAEEAGVWTIQSGVFPENIASLRLHEHAGFRIVGTRERIGRHHGRWRDTVLIERRSAVAGVG